MQIKTFTIPISDAEAAEAALNAFLRGHRVLQVQREFAVLGNSACWAFCVEYMEGDPSAKSVGRTGNKRERVDYKEVLSETAFTVFAKLREARKAWAEREGVPAYAVFTNEQLAAMVEPLAKSRSDLAKIEGVGDAKLEKYGASVLDVLRDETGETATGANSGTGESA